MKKLVQMKIVGKKGCAGTISTKASLRKIAKRYGFDVASERIGEYGEKYFTNSKGQTLQVFYL